MKQFVYMMLVSAAAGQGTGPAADFDPTMDMKKADGPSPQDMVPPGWTMCNPEEYNCPGTGMGCAIVTPIMPNIEEILKSVARSEGREMSKDELTMMVDMMKEGFENMPPIPMVCATEDQCGQMQSIDQPPPMNKQEFMIGCNGMGMPGDDKRRGGPDDDKRRGGDDEDRRGGGDSYITMNQDGVDAKIKVGRDIEFEYENDMRGNLKMETETGPIKTRTRMERGNFEMEARGLPDGGELMVEANDDGFRMMMKNASALGVSLMTASAMSMTLF